MSQTWRAFRSVHGIGLSAASLPIRKYADVVAVECALHHFLSLLEDVLLRGIRSEHGVVLELLLAVDHGLHFITFIAHHNLAASIHFWLNQGPNAAVYTNISFHVLQLVVQLAA